MIKDVFYVQSMHTDVGSPVYTLSTDFVLISNLNFIKPTNSLDQYKFEIFSF